MHCHNLDTAGVMPHTYRTRTATGYRVSLLWPSRASSVASTDVDKDTDEDDGSQHDINTVSTTSTSQSLYSVVTRRKSKLQESNNASRSKYSFAELSRATLTCTSLLHLARFNTMVANQLFNMGDEYVTNIVFGGTHKCLCILEDGLVVGGMCYKSFPGFTELVFCVIDASFAGRGLGSQLMNEFLDRVRPTTAGEVHDVLTFADNDAIGFFQKHGFTPEVVLDASAWQNKIKMYDGATLHSVRLRGPIPSPVVAYGPVRRSVGRSRSARLRSQQRW